MAKIEKHPKAPLGSLCTIPSDSFATGADSDRYNLEYRHSEGKQGCAWLALSRSDAC